MQVVTRRAIVTGALGGVWLAAISQPEAFADGSDADASAAMQNATDTYHDYMNRLSPTEIVALQNEPQLTDDERFALEFMRKEPAPQKIPGGPANPFAATDLVLIAAVGAMSLWFRTKGYKLAKELLDHARSNKSRGSSYTATNGKVLRETATFRNLLKGTKVSGTTSFPSGSSVAEADAYYAIHRCKWWKRGDGSITFTDVYDFALPDKSGSSDLRWVSCVQSAGDE